MANSKSNMQHLTCFVDKLDQAEGLNRLVAELKPGWIKEGFTYQKLTGGIVNTVFCCHLEEDVELKEAFIVRILSGMDAKQNLENTLEELRFIYGVAEKVGCGPAIMASFENGIVYKYVTGSSVSSSMMKTEHLMRKAVKLLARLHNADMDETSNPSNRIIAKEHFFARLRNLLEFVPEETDWKEAEQFPREITEPFRKSRLAEEFQFTENILNELNMKNVLCHNDFQYFNLVYNSETDSLTLIDYDLTCFNFESYDLSHLLFMRTYCKALSGADYAEDYDDDTMRLWIKYYLEAKAALKAQKTDGFSSTDVELMLIEIKMINVMSHLMLIMYAMTNLSDPNCGFTSFSTAQIAYEKYLRDKMTLPQLLKEHRSLQNAQGIKDI